MRVCSTIFAVLLLVQIGRAQEERRFAINSPAPEYPEAARARGLEGSGVWLLHIRRDGTVRSAELLKGSGHAILDGAAKAAFVRWHFIPGTVENVKVPFTYTVHGIPPGWMFVDEKKR